MIDAEVSGVVNDFGISLNANGQVLAGVGNPDTSIYSGTGYNNGAWHHVCFTRNKTNGIVTLYINGVSAMSGTGNLNSLAVPTRITIGCIQTNANYFNGSISKAVFYNRVISSDEVLKHYNEAIYSLRPNEGKYGGCIAIDENSTNLVQAPDTLASWASYTNSGTSASATFSIMNGELNPSYKMYKVAISNGGITGSDVQIFKQDNYNLSTSTTYTISVYAKAKFPGNGAMAVIKNASPYTAYSMSYLALNLTTAWQRFTLTFTTNTASTDGRFQLQFGGAGSAGNEIYFTMPQLEQKASATSFINGTRSDGIIEYPKDLISNSSDWTINMWIKPNGLGGISTNNQRLISTSNNIPDAMLTIWNYSPTAADIYDRRIISDYGNDAAAARQSRDLQSPKLFGINTWEMFTITYVSSTKTFTFYRNAEYWNSYTPVKINRVDHFRIWKANWNIDELRIDKRVASTEEILGWYVSQAPFYPKGIQRTIL